MEKSEINILWAEDNLGDILLIQEAFETIGHNYRLHVVNDGIEAMNFLNRTGRFSRAVRPDLLILDLNMPKKNGREVIKEIKTDPQLWSIPIVILSGHQQIKDVCAVLGIKPCIHLAKPSCYAEIEEIAKKIHDFWLSLNPKS